MGHGAKKRPGARYAVRLDGDRWVLRAHGRHTKKDRPFLVTGHTSTPQGAKRYTLHTARAIALVNGGIVAQL